MCEFAESSYGMPRHSLDKTTHMSRMFDLRYVGLRSFLCESVESTYGTHQRGLGKYCSQLRMSGFTTRAVEDGKQVARKRQSSAPSGAYPDLSQAARLDVHRADALTTASRDIFHAAGLDHLRSAGLDALHAARLNIHCAGDLGVPRADALDVHLAPGRDVLQAAGIDPSCGQLDALHAACHDSLPERAPVMRTLTRCSQLEVLHAACPGSLPRGAPVSEHSRVALSWTSFMQRVTAPVMRTLTCRCHGSSGGHHADSRRPTSWRAFELTCCGGW